MDNEYLFLKGTFNLSYGNKIELEDELSHDQVITSSIFGTILKSELLDLLLNHIITSVQLEQGKIPNIAGVRAQYYAALKGWCQDLLYHPFSMQGNEKTNGEQMAICCEAIANRVNEGSKELKDFFSFKKVTITSEFQKELKQLTNEYKQKDKLESTLFIMPYTEADHVQTEL
jgi:hypothetical protein